MSRPFKTWVNPFKTKYKESFYLCRVKTTCFVNADPFKSLDNDSFTSHQRLCVVCLGLQLSATPSQMVFGSVHHKRGHSQTVAVNRWTFHFNRFNPHLSKATPILDNLIICNQGHRISGKAVSVQYFNHGYLCFCYSSSI